jgi:hypothetical protein
MWLAAFAPPGGLSSMISPTQRVADVVVGPTIQGRSREGRDQLLEGAVRRIRIKVALLPLSVRKRPLNRGR